MDLTNMEGVEGYGLIERLSDAIRIKTAHIMEDPERRMKLVPDALPGTIAEPRQYAQVAAFIVLGELRNRGWLTPEAIEQLKKEGL